MAVPLSSLGWDEIFALSFRRLDRPDHRPARVRWVDRGVCCVLAVDGVHRVSLGGCVLAAAAGDAARLPGVGDWVAVRAWPDGRTTVEAVLPRRTVLLRWGAGAAAEVLAANIDAVAVVEPVSPEPDVGRIERLLAVGGPSGAPSLAVLTKIDQVVDPDRVAARVASALPGIEVCPVSAATGAGLARLQAHVAPGRTLGLLGGTGAGVPGLVRALVGAQVMGGHDIEHYDSIRSVRRPSARDPSLVLIPGGGAVVNIRAGTLAGGDR